MENINILGEYLNMRIESLNDRDVNYKWYMGFDYKFWLGKYVWDIVYLKTENWSYIVDWS